MPKKEKKPRNSNLCIAKVLKRDELYTRQFDIETELCHYKDLFRNKTVLCNCNDIPNTGFWEFFRTNFEILNLKRLISTHYEPEKDKPSYKIEMFINTNRDGIVDYKDTPLKTEIYGNGDYNAGDFRSEDCIKLLKEADIVCTNPPFSLFRQYLAQLMEYNKKFLIMGNVNAIGYKEIFPLLKDNKIWLGYMFGGAKFKYIPSDHKIITQEDIYSDESTDGWEKLGNICWFTNLNVRKRRKPIDLKHLPYTPEEYPKYDNYDAINVDRVTKIPCDYPGIMGVPITFMDKYCPDQFEIVNFRKGIDGRDLKIGMRYPFSRILVKNKYPEESKQRKKQNCFKHNTD